MRTPWIVTFDIGADPKRRTVNRLLARHGTRALYTVYELTTDTATVATLTEQLRPHLGAHDHLLALPTCERCRTATHGDPIECLPAYAWITT